MLKDQGEEELTQEDKAAIQAGLESLDKNGGVSMEVILADFGLTLAEFEKLATLPEPIAKPNG